MNVVDHFHVGYSVTLCHFNVNNTLVIRDHKTHDLMRRLIDFNLNQVNPWVVNLKYNVHTNHPVLKRIHTVSMALGKIMINPKLYVNILKATLAIAGTMTVGFVATFSLMMIPALFIYACKTIGVTEACYYLSCAWYLGIFKVVSYLGSHMANLGRSSYFYCTSIIEEAFIELEKIFSQAGSEMKLSYGDFVFHQSSSSCRTLEKEAVLNINLSDIEYVDPVTGEAFTLNIESAAQFRIGRYVLPIRSLIEHMIKSESNQIEDLFHPSQIRRILSQDELTKLREDFFNFFSCDLKLMNDILKITLTQEQQAYFPNPTNALQYIKASLFYKYIAHNHASFNPSLIIRTRYYEDLGFQQREDLHDVIQQIQTRLRLPK